MTLLQLEIGRSTPPPVCPTPIHTRLEVCLCASLNTDTGRRVSNDLNLSIPAAPVSSSKPKDPPTHHAANMPSREPKRSKNHFGPLLPLKKKMKALCGSAEPPRSSSSSSSTSPSSLTTPSSSPLSSPPSSSPSESPPLLPSTSYSPPSPASSTSLLTTIVTPTAAVNCLEPASQTPTPTLHTENTVVHPCSDTHTDDKGKTPPPPRPSSPKSSRIEDIYFTLPMSRENLSTNPGDEGSHSRKRRACTLQNWSAEIDRRLCGHCEMRDFAYKETEGRHAMAYGSGDGEA